MRKAFVTLSLLAMWGTLAFFLVTRGHDGAPVFVTPEPAADESDAGVADASDAAADAPPAPPASTLDRPLRIAAIGWDLIAPGLLANGGTAPSTEGAFGERGLEVHLEAVSSVDALEQHLARGGADERGADVAIMPLPTFAARFEQLQALSPEVFFVVGWSRGRHALYSRDGDFPNRFTKIVGRASSPEVFLAGTLADAMRVDLEELSVVERANSQSIAAVDRAGTPPADLRPILTTADATRAIAYVAVAQHALFEEHQVALAKFIEGWLSGVDTLRSDVPAAARTVASVPTSPDAVALVRRLGMVEFADLPDNARRFALSGRDPITLERLFSDSWRVWRKLGVLTIPRPAIPLQTGPITHLLLSRTPRAEDPTVTPSFEGDALLSVSFPRNAEAEEIVERAGWLAGIFAHAGVRVSAKTGRNRPSAEVLTSRIATRYGVTPRRFLAREHRARGVSLDVIGAE